MDENLLQGKTLLVVDDETDLRDIVASELEFMGGKVHQAENITIAKEILTQHKIDLIVSDIRMPGGTGVDLLDWVKSQDVNMPPVVLISGFADITVQEAFAKGAEALMNKPFQLDDLIQVATRLTGALDRRFLSEGLSPEHDLKLVCDYPFDDPNHFSMGRGGFAINFDPGGHKYELNETLNFDVTFTDRRISGIGICRWINHPDSQDGRITLGLEFMRLENHCLNFVLDNFNSKKSKALIPSL